MPVVFIGKVVAGGVESIRDDPWYKDAGFVRFEIVENLRGLAAGTKTVEMKTRLWPGMCAPNPYSPGRTYLVTPGSLNGTLFDGLCFTGRDVEHAKELIARVRRQMASPSRIYIRGRVGEVSRNDDSELTGYFLDLDHGKTLSGAKVWTTVNGREITTVTDETGQYDLTVPGRGAYTVQTSVTGRGSTKVAVTPTFWRGACKTVDLGILTGSSIAGRVWNRQGQTMPKTQVGLIDRDHPDRVLYKENSDASGAFVFRNVPFGRYSLLVEPDSQGAGRELSEEIVVSRADQTIVDRNAVAGPVVRSRRVLVKVRFPDGTPMSTARVVVTSGNDRWMRSAWRKKEGVELRVPAGRRLHISVVDDYRRLLNRVYESVHEAGEAPVEKTFVVDEP